MQRRKFITLLGGAVVARPLTAWAQQPGRVRRIGALLGISKSDPEAQPRISALRAELKKLGWEDGRNLNVEFRFGGSDVDSMRTYAQELVGLAPEVVVTQSNLAATAVLRETRTIPVVFTIVGDPVGSGYIKNLAHPGGNATGFTSFEPPIAGKWLDLLKTVAPQVTRAAAIMHLETTANVEFLRAAEAVSASIGVTLSATGVHDAIDIERSIDAFASSSNGGLIIFPNPVTNVHRDLILKLATRHQLPAIYPFRYFATGGGLMSYGIDVIDVYRRAAVYVDRILRGTKPDDLPVQQPTKFETVINLKTAKSLSLTIPPGLLNAADEVIEQ